MSDNDPFIPIRLLEEIVYWKTQEIEHTVVIRSLLPELEPPYVKLLQEWETLFTQTQGIAQQTRDAAFTAPDFSLPEQWSAALPKLAADSIAQSQEFSRQLQLLTEHSLAVSQADADSSALTYIRQQPEYFTHVSEQLEQAGAMQWLRNQESVDESTEGLEGPEPADEALRPALDSAMDNAVVPIGGHTLPPLPYSYKALEPYIDERTMRIHHDKHHQSYVDGLNKAEKELEHSRQTGNFDLVKNWERELAFNGAGHYLHTLFWDVMSPKGGGKPTGELLEEINRSFGSYEAFKKQFTEAANKVEGGGWAILVWSPRSRRLEILTAEKHQNLSQWDVIPLLPLDVWEHAYYLKHQNDRASYIQDWWHVVNWPYVSERYAVARTIKWAPF